MPWNHQIKPPISLKEGRTLKTLHETAQLLRTLPADVQAHPDWIYATQLLKDAAEDNHAALAHVDIAV
jgi:hypothetical protein